MVKLFVARCPGDYETGRQLFLDYQKWLGVDLTFQGFDEELERLPQMYCSPDGCLILGRDEGAALACVGVRRVTDDTCEMKRLFVSESARGQGLGRQLAQEAVRAAQRLGYSRMVLDTLASMTAAHRLYESMGFKEIEPYYETPVPGTRFMELDLRTPEEAG